VAGTLCQWRPANYALASRAMSREFGSGRVCSKAHSRRRSDRSKGHGGRISLVEKESGLVHCMAFGKGVCPHLMERLLYCISYN
jgi:hypothetical protein